MSDKNDDKLSVFLFNRADKLSADESIERIEGAVLVQLKHPKSNSGAMFMFTKDNEIVYEIISHQPLNKSWFIDDFVKSDGKLYLSAPIDPIFLVLPYLEAKTKTKALLLKDILMDEEYPEVTRLLQCSGLDFLHFAAEKQGQTYMYKEEKVIEWLDKKYNRLQKHLENVRSKADADIAKEACGILSQYLSASTSQTFVDHRGFTNCMIPCGKKRISAFFQQQTKKRKL